MSYADLVQTRGIRWASTDIDPIARQLSQFLLHKELQPFKYELRASMLPFCPRMYSLGTVLKEKELPLVPWTFMDNAILSIGSLTHEILQSWYGKAGTLVGYWKCPRCGKRKFHEGTPGKCKDCRRFYQYEELSLRDKKTGLTAHPDGLFYTSKRVLEGLEFKTIVEANLNELRAPMEEHLKYQAATYARLLKSNLGFDIRHFSFIYINRNLPSSFKILYSREEGSDLKVVATGYAGKFTLLKIFRREIDFSLIDEEFKKIRLVQKVQEKYPDRLIPRDYKHGWALCRDAYADDARFCPLGPTVCFSRWPNKHHKDIRSSRLPDLP